MAPLAASSPWGVADVQLQHAQTRLFDLPGVLGALLKVTEDQAWNDIGVSLAGFDIQCRQFIEPFGKLALNQPGTTEQAGVGWRREVPRQAPPVRIQQHIIGLVQLLLGSLGFIGGFGHYRADPGGQGGTNGLAGHGLFPGAADDRVFQRQPADRCGESRHGRSTHRFIRREALPEVILRMSSSL